MRIGMVSKHQCIRVLKESIALMSLGHHITGITQQLNYGYNLLDAVAVYTDDRSLQRMIKQLEPSVDIWHCHNEPDTFVRLVKEVSDKPLVWDIHDLACLWAGTEPSDDEYDCMNMADAFVHVGDAIRARAEEIHPIIKDKPNITLHLFVNEIFMQPVCAAPSWSTVVYEGGLVSTGVKEGEGKQLLYNIRYWYPVFDKFLKDGYNVTALAASDSLESIDVYRAQGVSIFTDLPYPSMLNALQPFGFGLVGAFAKFPIIDVAMPNKLFEYMSQGVVPVVINATECAKFVTNNQCGIVLDGMDNLQEQLAPGPELRKNVLAMRRAMTMEDQIHKLVNVYRSLL